MSTKTAALQAENAELQRVLRDSVRFMFHVAPALTPVIGEELVAAAMVPTTDQQGVIFSGTAVDVTVVPATEMIIITGNGTAHRLEVHAHKGKLDAEQIVHIVATVAAIKAVRGKKADPLVDGLDLLGHAKVAVSA